MIDAAPAPDPPNPRRIKLLVEPRGVTLLWGNNRTPVWVGSAIIVRSNYLDVVTGHGFQPRKVNDPSEEWIASLGTTPEGLYVLAIPVVCSNVDGHVIFQEFGTYLIGYPNYLRMLQSLPMTRKASWDKGFVQNRSKILRRNAKRKRA